MSADFAVTFTKRCLDLIAQYRAYGILVRGVVITRVKATSPALDKFTQTVEA
jgi:uncharacterized protein (UPF0371 family)